MPEFSICIPNYNYDQYLATTIDSVLAQTHGDLEVVVVDNASTDGSVDLVKKYARLDRRVRLVENRRNVGFSGNLLKAGGQATGRFMILLSSDDVMKPHALEAYSRLFRAMGDLAEQAVVHSTVDVIDGSGALIGERSGEKRLWAGASRSQVMSDAIGLTVLEMDAHRLLRNSVHRMRNPFYFLSTAYSKALHDSVEGYSQGGLINPDKRFAWSVLARSFKAYCVMENLFQYRVHATNQNSLQAKARVLKHPVDQYVSTFDADDAVLGAAGVNRQYLAERFIEEDIVLRGLAACADGDHDLARRLIHFGKATYPAEYAANKKTLMLRIAANGGRMSQVVLSQAKRQVENFSARKQAQADL